MNLPEGLLLSFYGDDFTGSTDGMEALAKAGLRTLLFLAPPASKQLARFEGLRAVGVAGISRSLSPEQMDAELPPIFEKMRVLPARLFHVKVCSTFDSSPIVGSIGRTIEIGQAIFQSTPVPLVVGAPILGRYVVFGSLFARYSLDAPHVVYRLDRHPTMSRHPITPMQEADLPTHLGQQTTQRIASMNVLMLEGSEEEIDGRLAALLEKEAPDVVLFDTLTDAQLQQIGRLLWKRISLLPQPLLPQGGEGENPFPPPDAQRPTPNAQRPPPLFTVGSSGVEYALTAFWRSQGWLPEPPVFQAEPVEQIVVVSGSCSPVTARQIEWAEENGFVSVALDPVRLLSPEAAVEEEQMVAQALGALAEGRSVVLHTAQGMDDPRRRSTVEYLERHGLDSGKTLGVLLGRLLRTLLWKSGIRRAVVCGGDTSGYAARELGLEALETLLPMAPGSPLCRAYAPDSPLDGLEILFKGGQVGSVDLFGRVLAARP